MKKISHFKLMPDMIFTKKRGMSDYIEDKINFNCWFYSGWSDHLDII